MLSTSRSSDSRHVSTREAALPPSCFLRVSRSLDSANRTQPEEASAAQRETSCEYLLIPNTSRVEGWTVRGESDSAGSSSGWKGLEAASSSSSSGLSYMPMSNGVERRDGDVLGTWRRRRRSRRASEDEDVDANDSTGDIDGVTKARSANGAVNDDRRFICMDFEQATRTTRSRITSTSTSLTSRRSMSTRETSRRSTSAKDECDLEDDLGEVVEHNLKDEIEVHLISYNVKV
mmetsp:Transcript_49252/g.104728  ORF Transcript_49252/g.104728 Transcript_49252/m.104728 type:complete len:233 (+) Transcript_49252:464-1162(+)